VRGVGVSTRDVVCATKKKNKLNGIIKLEYKWTTVD